MIYLLLGVKAKPHNYCRLLPFVGGILAAFWGNGANLLFASDYVRKFFSQRTELRSALAENDEVILAYFEEFLAKMTELTFGQP